MNKHYRVYWEKLLETVAFSYGKVSLYELVQKEHKHFHPSQNLHPSKDDTRLTDRMIKLTELMGIPLLDHIIVGGDNREYFSFREKCFMTNPLISYNSNYETLEFSNNTMVAEKGKSR